MNLSQMKMAVEEPASRPPRDIPAWKMGRSAVGWLLPGLLGLGCAVCLLFYVADQVRFGGAALILIHLMPLTGAVGGGLLFAPDEEPALELLLSKPRAPYWLLLERAGVLLAVLTAIGLAATGLLALITPLLGGFTFFQLFAGWWIPTVALGGVAMACTFFARRVSGGVLVGLLLFGGLAIGGDMLVARYPFLWPLHLFAPAWSMEEGRFWVTRIVWLAIALWAASLAVRAIRNEEQLIMSRGGREG